MDREDEKRLPQPAPAAAKTTLADRCKLWAVRRGRIQDGWLQGMAWLARASLTSGMQQPRNCRWLRRRWLGWCVRTLMSGQSSAPAGAKTQRRSQRQPTNLQPGNTSPEPTSNCHLQPPSIIAIQPRRQQLSTARPPLHRATTAIALEPPIIPLFNPRYSSAHKPSR
jgi:hypothetical protein